MDALGVLFGLALLFIPIVALIVDAIQKTRERSALHRERMKAIEMGLAEIPKALLDPAEFTHRRRRHGPGIHGVIWTAIGLGVITSTEVVHFSGEDWPDVVAFFRLWAIPATFVGIGLLLYAWYLSRRPEGNGNGGATPPAAG